MKTLFTICLLLFGAMALQAQNNGKGDYTNGFMAYFKKDYATAMTHYQRAVAKGNAKAMLGIGDLYEGGYGVAKNPEEAKKWYEKGHQRYVVLAQAGDAKADAELADLYYKGDKIEKNFDKALKYYLPKALGGNASDMVRVAHIYEFGGFGTTKDLKKAAEWYLKADEYGQNVSGALQRLGISTPKKLSAEDIYTKMMAEATSKADPSEHRALAMKLYVKQLKAENVPTASINQKAKEKLQKMAAIDFYATFRSMLGLVDIPVNELNTLFTPQQQAVMKDLAKSLTNKTPYPSSAPAKGQPWSARGNTATYASANTAKQANTAPTKPNNPISSPQANTVSTTNTAIKTTSTTTTSDPCGIPEYGKGFQAYILKNYAEALKWFKIAAEKSCEKAAAKLGAMYHAGLGVSINQTEGFKWYKLAAEGGDLESKYMVGLSYTAGIGVQQNYPEARKWLKEAAKEGYPKSPETLWGLDKNIFALMLMSPNQLHDWEGSNGKLGYKDKASGSVWIPAKYEDGGLISEVEQLAPAKLNGKWGFIDLYDKTVIPFQYEDAEPLSFIEGLAAVKQNGKWGFIDKSGKTIIPFQYDKVELGCFVNGYAKVIQNGKTLFIHNPLDKVSTTTKSTAAATTQTKPSSNSNASLAQLPLTPFKGTNGKYGYKDQNGKVITQPKYDFASYTFGDGLAQIRNNGKIGFIDQRGKEIIPLQYKGAYRFSEGLSAVTSGEDKWMFIDKTNTKVLELPDYVYTTGSTANSDEMIFSEGLAPVRIHLLPYEKSIHDFTNPENVKRITKELGISSSFTEADKKKLHDYLTPLTKQAIQDPYRYSYIDKSGTLIIDPFKGYHTAKQFSEGLAAVGNYAPGNTYRSSDAKYIFGFIDKTGKLVVPMKYEKSRPYREGLAAVMSNKVWGFVDKNGKEVVPPQLGWVNNFKSGYAIVAHGKIVPGQEFNPFDKDAVWGIIGKDGKAVVPITHFSVSMNEDGMVTTENGNLKTQVHISGYEEFNKGHIAIQNKQYQEAVRHLLLAAEKGHGGAMGNIGILYASGTGVEKSIEKGLEWMKKGAEHNDLHSMLNLGLHFAQNHPQNFNESFKWLKKASDHNYAQAMGHLAMLYATGQGTTQNSDEAKKWLDKGVAMRDAHCMFNYGVLYYQGVPGFTKDKDKAVQWMNKAKTAGHPQANAALQQISEAQK